MPTPTIDLAAIRTSAESVAEYIDGVVSDDPAEARVSRTYYAYGGLLGTTLGALYELARPEPDVARLHAILRGGLASSEAIRGKLDSALAMLVEIDATRPAHYLVPGEFWCGVTHYNWCSCGRKFERGGAPCMSDAEDHVRASRKGAA